MKLLNKSFQSAFTLVELSMVLVIMTLLVAAVTSGKALLKASYLRTLITQIHNIENITAAFIEQYDAIPGDMSNASSTFGVSQCPASPCNGNGSGIIEWDLTDNRNKEVYNYFKHLYLAGLVDTKYDGMNAPIVRYGNANMTPRYVDGTAMSGMFFRAGHIMEIGKVGGSGPSNGANLANRNNYIAIEVYNLDIKIDDGVGNTGGVYGINGNGQYISVNNVANGIRCAGYSYGTAGADYGLKAQTKTCFIGYWVKALQSQ